MTPEAENRAPLRHTIMAHATSARPAAQAGSATSHCVGSEMCWLLTSGDRNEVSGKPIRRIRSAVNTTMISSPPMKTSCLPGSAGRPATIQTGSRRSRSAARPERQPRTGPPPGRCPGKWGRPPDTGERSLSRHRSDRPAAKTRVRLRSRRGDLPWGRGPSQGDRISPLHVSGLLGRKLRCAPRPAGLACGLQPQRAAQLTGKEARCSLTIWRLRSLTDNSPGRASATQRNDA